MKREQIKSELTDHLVRLGFRQGVNCVFQPDIGQLILLLDGAVEVVKLRMNMSRMKFNYEIGYIAGIAKAHGLKAAAKVAAAVNGTGSAKQWSGAIGMPALAGGL